MWINRLGVAVDHIRCHSAEERAKWRDGTVHARECGEIGVCSRFSWIFDGRSLDLRYLSISTVMSPDLAIPSWLISEDTRKFLHIRNVKILASLYLFYDPKTPIH